MVVVLLLQFISSMQDCTICMLSGIDLCILNIQHGKVNIVKICHYRMYECYIDIALRSMFYILNYMKNTV